MEFTPVFLGVADNSTFNLMDENKFLCQKSLFITPLEPCESAFLMPSRSTEELHVSPSALASRVDPEALYYVSLCLVLFFVTSLLLTGLMFVLEHYRQFQLQKKLLSRAYFSSTPLQDVCSSQKVQCCIMLDDQYKFDCIRCPAGHWVGRDALQRHIEFESQKPLDVTCGEIKCPLCEHRYDDQSLAFFCGPEAFQAYQKMRQTKVHQEEKANVLAQIEEDARKKERDADRKIIQEAIRNQFQIGDGQYYGYMCPTCGFGPVDHMECDDLQAHQGEFKDYGVEIDNCCPMCMWYGENKTDWGEWKGEFLEGEQLEATQKAVDEWKIPFEEFKHEALERLQELKSLITVASVNQRFSLLQEIAPREFPETSKNVSYCDEAEDPSDIMFNMRNAWCNTRRFNLTKELIKTMDAFRVKDLKSEFKYKTLKKEQKELVQELKDRREAMKENIQIGVKNLGYKIVVTHPPSEDDEEDYF